MADGFNTEDMLDMYLLENQQLLEILQKTALEQKDKPCFEEDVISEMFRTMHTIKGSSGVMMFDNITAVSHKLEDIFSVLREDHPEHVPHLQLVEHILEVSDFITAELEKIQRGEAADGDPGRMIEALDAFLKMIRSETGAKVKKEEKKAPVAQQFYIAPAANGSSDSSSFLMIDLESSVEEIEARAEAKRQALVPGDFVIQKKRAEKAAYIHVDVAKMDQLMDLMGELVLSQAAVLQNPDLKVPGLSLDDFQKSATQMIRISTELQNVIMSMRMVPLTNTFQKMNRIVFDMSRKLGKDIEFVAEGGTTEIDKNIVEHISDPLMHLVRNAADHGIEMPEERIAAGKTERGRVTLSAKIESGKVRITVADNGKGLDRVRIMKKAREQGLLDHGKPESAYTDKEVYQLITRPGFSTREYITEYSGRGVGMDVVLSNIASVGGSLEIESEKGLGSRMILKIPLTLAVINGIVMEAGDASYVIDTGVVKEFVSVCEDQIFQDEDGREFAKIQGEYCPVLRIGERYHVQECRTNVEKGVLVIVEVDGQQFALFAERLIGKQEIVVKPVPAYRKEIKGISGCTQLGDGKIALIIDGTGLADEYKTK